MVEERWLEAAEAYRRYCDIENDVSNEIVLNFLLNIILTFDYLCFSFLKNS